MFVCHSFLRSLLLPHAACLSFARPHLDYYVIYPPERQLLCFQLVNWSASLCRSGGRPLVRPRIATTSRFSDAFAKLRKATTSFVMSVRLSAWNSSVPANRIFVNFDI